ncbi:VOC family protein [Tropicibacter alexandrii]|uniref:VOC family protein n=1 Tax=Tropicibacter alexandrii TaxID=2267683 RepID=UPI000EF4654B|nr:VOC family protein [Tropicibacter alexandrii]
MPLLTGILEAALYVDDLDAAHRFYGQMLGLEQITRVDGRHAFYRAGATIVLLFLPDATAIPPAKDALPVPPHGAHGPGHLCFACPGEALDQMRALLEDHGLTIESDFNWPHGPRSIYVRDPAGNSVEFADPTLWSPTA